MHGSATSDRKNFVLIDGHALIYRAYHAFPDLSTSDGTLVNAVYGFARVLLTVIKDFEPEYIAVTFDHPKPTFRHAEYIGYKSTRAEMPDDLKPQVALVKEVVEAFNIPQFELPGYEADDLIGTLTHQIKKQWDGMVIIVTGDRDSFQLVDERVHIWMPSRGKMGHDMEYDAEAVEKKMGVRPDQIIDLKALMGDASDNIPGVTGIGEKTAVKLIQEFGTLEKIYQTITTEHLEPETSKHPVLKGAVLRKLIDGYEQALMSQKLARMDCESPITLDLEACKTVGYTKEKVVELFEKLEFNSLLRLLPADQFEMEVQGALF